jgi:hypothetical protein
MNMSKRSKNHEKQKTGGTNFMVTKTLKESLELLIELGKSYDRLDAAEEALKTEESPTNLREVEIWKRQITKIKKRMDKLPNYYLGGVSKLTAFLERSTGQYQHHHYGGTNA